MSNRNYAACLTIVSAKYGHLKPPPAFLDTLIDTVLQLHDDSVFARNEHYDIYSVMQPALGPYTDLLHRKAVMCEVLRVQAAFESDWNWNESVDTGKANSKVRPESEETGAFQVSWDSMTEDKSLRDCMVRHTGKDDVQTFIASMKADHALAIEYCARLFRFNTRWCGTVNNRDMVLAHVRRDAVDEFKRFLGANDAAGPAAPPVAAPEDDAACIGKLLGITSDAEADVKTFKEIQDAAAHKLLVYDGEIYPTDGCAITLSLLLQKAGIDVHDTYMAVELTNLIRYKRKWQVVPVGQQQPGDIGTTCGEVPVHGKDHIYLVAGRLNNDLMQVADNQKPRPHPRSVSGADGRTATKYFLRAVKAAG